MTFLYRKKPVSVVVLQEGPQRPQESKDEDLFVVRLVAVVVLKKFFFVYLEGELRLCFLISPNRA